MPLSMFVRKCKGSYLAPYSLFIVAILIGITYGIGRVVYYKIFHHQLLGLHVASSMAYLLLVSPIWEEIVFRGILLEGLIRRIRGSLWFSGGLVSYANLSTSFIFAAMHLLTQSPASAVTIIIPSLILGMVYEKYRSVALCIVVHISYNINVYIY